MTEDFETLKERCRNVRIKSIQMAYEAGTGHIASGLSMVELIVAIYSRYSPALTDDRGKKNHFVLSKGHGALSLYALLILCGTIDENKNGYLVEGSDLTAFPGQNESFGLDFSSGSLGHGLSVAAGIAYGLKNSKAEGRVCAVLSDGECQEGSTWEAVQFAGHHRLSNLTGFVDVNGLQAIGSTRDILSQDMLAERFEKFGFNVLEVDGHDIEEIFHSLEKAEEHTSAPTMILAKTVKGKGIRFMENDLNWHYLPLSPEQFSSALSELNSL